MVSGMKQLTLKIERIENVAHPCRRNRLVKRGIVFLNCHPRAYFTGNVKSHSAYVACVRRQIQFHFNDYSGAFGILHGGMFMKPHVPAYLLARLFTPMRLSNVSIFIIGHTCRVIAFYARSYK